jgi:glutamine amidotransferase
MIAIIDYGLGNICSVVSAVEKLGYEVLITSKSEDIEKAQKIILPGVGAFADGMKNLKALGLDKILTELVCKCKKPILGICLGFHLMSMESFEMGLHKGLGWIDASVHKIKAKEKLKVPHVGWNDLFQSKKNNIFSNIPSNALFYYLHSYYVQCHDNSIVVGESEYGARFASVVVKDNIVATQFHPEKSQRWGLQLIKNYLDGS